MLLEENQVLEVSKSIEGDAGEYYCNASNIEAYDIKSFRVKILSKWTTSLIISIVILA